MNKQYQKSRFLGLPTSRKAQVWITDFIVGFMIFSIGIILASKFIFNSMGDNEFSKLQSEAYAMSDHLLSDGIPANWTNETIVRIGLTSNNRLNITKVSAFYNMSYDDTKFYLSSRYDYIIFFQQNNTLLNLTKCFYGNINMTGCTLNTSSLEYDNLVRISRLVVFNNSIVEMVLYLWE